MSQTEELLGAIRSTLAAHSDPERAPAMQAYMKSELPYLGIAKPRLRMLLRAPLNDIRLDSRTQWETAIRRLWDEATHREQWYAALGLARHRYYRQWRADPQTIGLIEHLVRTGHWWDVCDETAEHLLAPLVGAHRDTFDPLMRRWARDPDLWVRRVAIQSQISLKGATDPNLLAATIEPNLADPTFWLRKAIGWSLREFSKIDPEWVRDFVRRHDEAISGLSRREALRLIDR